jgi:chromate transporter
LFTIGGGYAMLPMIRNEVVLSWQWITEESFVNFIGIAESTPGPFAINMATFVGYHTAGVLGSLCATVGVVLPSFVIILIIAKLFAKFNNSKLVKNMFWGFKPVVAGLILSAAVTLCVSAILPNVSFKDFNFDFSNFDAWALGIFIVIFALSRIKIKGKKTHPFVLVITSAVLGIIIYGALPLLA